MDKKVLKEVLVGLTKDQEIQVNFRGSKSSLNGLYKVLEVKTDRGKMGSRKATLLSMTDNSQVIVHTKTNEEVLNIVVDGKTFGSVNESDEPRSYTKNVVRGKELAVLFKTFTKDQKVEVSSEVESYLNGVFTVVSSTPSPGKFGQQKLVLKDNNGTDIEVWSYRHSTVIKDIKVVQ